MESPPGHGRGAIELDRLSDSGWDGVKTVDRLALAEQVCLLYGWTGADNSERGKALHELWAEWLRVYEAEGGSTEPRRHPELSDARIKELAARRDATVAKTLAAIRGGADQ